MAQYKPDHVRVLKALGDDLPERPSMTTEQITAKTFRRCENADRRIRNAYRMIRAAGHASIIKRGVYRLTANGAKHLERILGAVATTGKKTGKKKVTKQPIKPRATRPRKKLAAAPRKVKHPIPVVERTLIKEAASSTPAPKPKGNHSPKKQTDVTAALSF